MLCILLKVRSIEKFINILSSIYLAQCLVILSLVNLPNMSNQILAITNSKLDTRVKEPSGVVPPPSGVGIGSTLDRFTI